MSLRKPRRYRGSGGTAPLTLNLGTRRKWIGIFTPWSIGPRGKRPGTHGREDWVGPKAGPGTLESRNVSLPYQESNDDSSVLQAIAWSLRRRCPYLTAPFPPPTSEYVHDFPKRKENQVCLSHETVINTSRENTQCTLTTHNKTPSFYVFQQLNLSEFHSR
jgi:transposase